MITQDRAIRKSSEDIARHDVRRLLRQCDSFIVLAADEESFWQDASDAAHEAALMLKELRRTQKCRALPVRYHLAAVN